MRDRVPAAPVGVHNPAGKIMRQVRDADDSSKQKRKKAFQDVHQSQVRYQRRLGKEKIKQKLINGQNKF